MKNEVYERAFEEACDEYDFKLAHSLFDKLEWTHEKGLKNVATRAIGRFFIYLITLEEIKGEDAFYYQEMKVLREILDEREEGEIWKSKCYEA